MNWKTMSIVERVEAVKPHAIAGLSGSEIGARFSDRPSRSAVIGLCHRNGIKLSARHGRKPGAATMPKPVTAPSRPKAKPKLKPEPKRAALTPRLAPAAPPPPRREPVELRSEPMTFMDALDRNRCRWPLWNLFEGPHTSLCCGGVRSGIAPYCEHHHVVSQGAGTESERRASRDLKRHIMRQRGIV